MLDFLLLAPEPLSLEDLSSRLVEKGWTVKRARLDRIVVSLEDSDYVAIEKADDSRHEFDPSEWNEVITRVDSPRIFYFKYLSRPLVGRVLRDIAAPGMFVDENDRLLEIGEFR